MGKKIGVSTKASDRWESYVKDLRRRDKELAKGWGQIATPLRLQIEGGIQQANCANTEGIFRIIQSIGNEIVTFCHGFGPHETAVRFTERRKEFQHG